MQCVTMMFIIISTFLLFTGESYGIECIHCTDYVVDTSSIPSRSKDKVDGIIHTYRTPKCENAHTVEVDKGITMKTCKSVHGNSSGEVSKCGRLVGTVKVSIYRKIVVPVTFHIRGCLNVEQSLNGRCYQDKSILDQQRGVLSNHLKRLIDGLGFSVSFRLGELNGVLCVNGPNNTDPWRRNAAMGHTYNWMTFFVCAMVSLFFIYKI